MKEMNNEMLGLECNTIRSKDMDGLRQIEDGLVG